MEKFDYEKALKELEEIARKVEDPSAGLDGIDSLVKRSAELVDSCRKYLRSARESLDAAAEDII